MISPRYTYKDLLNILPNSGEYDPFSVETRCISTPLQTLAFEQRRRIFASEEGIAGPKVDLFVMASGISTIDEMTNIGGYPLRNRRKEWPSIEGCNLAYIGQLNVSQSRDLFSFELPGDLLLIYANKDFRNQIIFHTEWEFLRNCDRVKQIKNDDLYFKHAYYGTVYRTSEFIQIGDAYDKYYASLLGFDMAINGTKLGGNPQAPLSQQSTDVFIGQIGPVFINEGSVVNAYFGDIRGLCVMYNKENGKTHVF